MSTQSENSQIAQYLMSVFGSRDSCSVNEYLDENENVIVDILCCNGSSKVDLKTFATIGLSDFAQFSNQNGKLVGVEVIGTCLNENQNLDLAISSLASNVKNFGFSYLPDTIHSDVLGQYDSALEMDHILLVDPFYWKPELVNLELKSRVVTWVQALPISKEEKKFAIENGIDALQEKFVAEDISWFDISRNSIF